MTDVVVEKKGHVAVVKIEHMKAMNALSTDMYAQLEEAFDEVAKMDDVYCVILTGSSTVNKKGKTVNSFVAGADIAQMSTMTVAEGKFFGNDSNRVCWKIENFKRPVIAAINGFCLGGGCELAMSLRHPPGVRQRAVRPAGSRSGHHPGLRRHPASGPPGRHGQGQGNALHRPRQLHRTGGAGHGPGQLRLPAGSADGRGHEAG